MGSSMQRLCGRCGSVDLRRSRTRIWERPLRLLLLRPYRCRDCEHRQYGSFWAPDTALQQQPCSTPEGRLVPGLLDASAGSVRVGYGKQWIVYGLLTCLLIAAISSMMLGNKLLVKHSLSILRSWLRGPTKTAPGKSPDPEISIGRLPRQDVAPATSDYASPGVKAAPEEASQGTSEANAKAAASAQSSKRTPLVSREERASSFSSAAAITAPRPKLPAHIQANITGDNTVDVRVQIDSAGRVVDAKPVSIRGPAAASLVPYSLGTARQWRFQPARRYGKAVPSASVLEFLFRPSDVLVSRHPDPAP